MADPGLDRLLDALGPEDAGKILAELLSGESAPADTIATRPQDVKARLKELTAKRPDLIAKIITYWIKEERRRPGRTD